MTNQEIIFAQTVSVGRTQQMHNDEHEVHGAAGVLVRLDWKFYKTNFRKICKTEKPYLDSTTPRH
jgi:hypothetical protein